MKKLLIILIPVAFIGCSTLDKALLTSTPNAQQVTNTVPQAVQVPVVVKTADGITVTNLITQTNFVIQVQTVTNQIWQVKPAIDTALTTAQGAAPFIPPPYGTAVSVGLTALSGLLAVYAKKKNDQASNYSDMLAATVDGVESVSNSLGTPVGTQIKSAIKLSAKQSGVQTDLDQFVQSRT